MILLFLPSTVISWIAKRRMIVQIMPSVIFMLPSTISKKKKKKVNKLFNHYNVNHIKLKTSLQNKIILPSAPTDTSLTPLLSMKSSALFTFDTR